MFKFMAETRFYDLCSDFGRTVFTIVVYNQTTFLYFRYKTISMKVYSLLLVVMVTVVKFCEGIEQDRIFTAVTVDGRVSQYSYPSRPESECIFDEHSTLATCIGDFSYANVTSVWIKTPDVIMYISLNCLTRGTHKGQYCACANNDKEGRRICQLEVLGDYIFRSLVNLEVLDLSNNRIKSISAQSLIGLNKLKYLSLHNNHIKTLPNGLLCQCPNLEFIDMSENVLIDFPRHALRCKKNFSKLTIMNVANNNLSSIADHSMDSSPSMVSLDLSNNSLYNVSKSSLAGGKSIECLSLSQNHIRDVFNYFCDYFPNMSHIDIHDNAFQSFNLDYLNACSSLTFLDLSNNSLEHLLGNTSNLEHLKVLNVSDNNLNYLTDSLTELKSLELFDSSYNQIESLPDSLFSELKSLTLLDLSSNLINVSDNFDKVFSGLSGLHALNLSFNKIMLIPDNSFLELEMLKELYLGNNYISELQPLSFAGLKQLERILLDNNRLEELPRDIFKPIRNAIPLKQLSLSHNGLSDLSSVSEWPLITSFVISHNKLMSMPSAINFSGMKMFDISHNKLGAFFGKSENLVADFEALEKLDISFNQISDIRTDIFQLMKNLTSFNAQQNRIQFNFTTEIFRNPSLSAVNLALNNISNIQTIFSDNSLQILRSLNLSGNPIGLNHIGILSKSFQNSYLESIDLSNCNITALDAAMFFDLHNLTKVDLHGNRLTVFPVLFAQKETIYNLKNNPLVCDCTMSWLSQRFVNFVYENTNISVDTQHYQVPKCKIISGETYMYHPHQLSRDQFLCAEMDKCDSSCTCFKTSSDGEIFSMKCQNGLHTVPDVLPSSAKVIFLDGNSFSANTSLSRLTTLKNMTTKELHLNRSSVRYIVDGLFLAFDRLEFLDLSHNLITTLTTDMFKTQNVLRQLFLNDNRIQTIEPGVFNDLYTIQSIDLSGNELVILSPDIATELLNLDYIKHFSLARNKWLCGCSNLQLKDFVDEVLYKIMDRNQLTCASGVSLGKEIKDAPRSEFLCTQEDEPSNKKLIGILIAVICVCILVFAVCVYYRRELLALLFYKTGCHIPGKRRYPGVHFDTYVAYDLTDQHCSYYVQNTVIPKLKNNSYNFQTSADVIQDIEVSRKIIEDSRCSVFIVDKNFSANDFLVKIFLYATELSKRTKRHKVVMIVHGDIDLVVLEPEIVSRMRKGDYITARSRLWWERFVYELPEPSSSCRHGDEDDEEVVVFSSLSENQGQYEQF